MGVDQILSVKPGPAVSAACRRPTAWPPDGRQRPPRRPPSRSAPSRWPARLHVPIALWRGHHCVDRRHLGPRLRGRRAGLASSLGGDGDDTRSVVVAGLVAVWGCAPRLAHRRSQSGPGRGPPVRRAARAGAPQTRRSTARERSSCPRARDVDRLAARAGGEVRARAGGAAPSSASRCGWSASSSRASATRSSSGSVPTRPTRARSWTAGSGATPATPTTSATPRVVGPVPDRRPAVARRADDPVAGADDVHAHRQPASRSSNGHGRAPARLPAYVERTSGFIPLPPKRGV